MLDAAIKKVYGLLRTPSLLGGTRLCPMRVLCACQASPQLSTSYDARL